MTRAARLGAAAIRESRKDRVGLLDAREAAVEEPVVEDGHAVADPERDLAKIAVVERHLGTGRMAVGLVRGFGLRSGALASTFSHDAHNIVVLGVDDHDMAACAMRLAEIGGGIVIADGGQVVESGSHRDLLRQPGLYAELYNEQFEGGRVQWCCDGGDVMADGSVRKRETQPA